MRIHIFCVFFSYFKINKLFCSIVRSSTVVVVHLEVLYLLRLIFFVFFLVLKYIILFNCEKFPCSTLGDVTSVGTHIFSVLSGIKLFYPIVRSSTVVLLELLHLLRLIFFVLFLV